MMLIIKLGLVIIQLMIIINCDYVRSTDLNSGIFSNYDSNNNRTGRFEAIFVFGDSLVEPGNDLMIKNSIRANHPPYGRDLPGGRPVGKFCNGLLASDFIASFAGLPYPMAYLQDKNNILKGTSFASCGAVIYPDLGYYKFPRLVFKDQLSLFEDARKRLISTIGNTKASYVISNSLFTFCIGSDDFLTNYLGNPLGKSAAQKAYSIDAFVELLISMYRGYLMALYKLGGRQFAMFNVPPLGCSPLEAFFHGKEDGTCISEINDEVRKFNNALLNMTKELQAEHPNANFVYLDFFGLAFDAINNPSNYGFISGTKPCCSTGPKGGVPICNVYVSSICTNATEYVFWDFAHPSERANYLIARAFWSGSPSYVYPFSLSELAML